MFSLLSWLLYVSALASVGYQSAPILCMASAVVVDRILNPGHFQNSSGIFLQDSRTNPKEHSATGHEVNLHGGEDVYVNIYIYINMASFLIEDVLNNRFATRRLVHGGS